MAAFHAFAAAFEADLDAIFAKYAWEDTDEIYLSEYLDGEQTTNSDNSKDEGQCSSADEKEEDDTDDGWDSDASGPSHLHDLSSGDSRETLDAAPIRNDTYVVAEQKDCIEEQDIGDSESESFTTENEGKAVKLQHEVSLSHSKSVQVSDIETQEYKSQGSNSRVCDATFVIDSHEVCLSPRLQRSSSTYCKPVSVIQPIFSLPSTKVSVKKTFSPKEDCFINDNTRSDSEFSTDLVKAVLYSRNKIALALAGISQEKERRSSQVCSKEATHQTGGKLLMSNQTGKASRFCSMDNSVERKVGDRREGKAAMIRSLAFEWGDKTCQVPDSERYQSLSPSTDKPRPFARRQSVTIIPTSPSTKTLKLENCNPVKSGMSSPALKQRGSNPLCKLNGSTKTVEQGSCSIDSLSTLSGSKALEASPRNRQTPSVQYLVSPAHPSRPLKTMRRRSSQILRVSERATTADSRSTLKKKATHLEYHNGSPRKCQVLKSAFVEKGNEFCENAKESITEKDRSKDSSEDAETEERSSKTDTRKTSSKGRVAKGSSSSQPNQQKLSEFLGCCETVLGKANGFKRQGKCSPVTFKNGRDDFSKSNVESVISNSELTSFVEANCKEKSESHQHEVDNRENHVRLSIKSSAEAKIRHSGSTSLYSQRKSCCDPGCGLLSTQRMNNNFGNAINNDHELKNKQKIAQIRSPSSICASKGGLSMEQTIQLFCKKGLKPTGLRAAGSYLSSTSGSTRMRIVQSGNIGNERTPPLRPQIRKRTARESVAMDTPDSLPRKQPKRGPSMSNSVECELSSLFGSESLIWQGRESTPSKGKSVKRLRTEEFSPQNMELLSPIRRPVAETCVATRRAVLSPCKGSGCCDKTFCFDCS